MQNERVCYERLRIDCGGVCVVCTLFAGSHLKTSVGLLKNSVKYWSTEVKADGDPQKGEVFDVFLYYLILCNQVMYSRQEEKREGRWCC
jgi:hypothetical protein